VLDSIFGSSIDIKTILLCLVVSIVLGILIALVHKKTAKCSKNFLITLSILPSLVAIMIFMVNGNLGTSVAILGAFGLIRFRSMPGTSKEILSVFFAMSIGLIAGMGYLAFAVIITLFISVMLLILDKVNLFNKEKEEKILKITIPENLDYTNVFDDLFLKYTTSHELRQVKSVNMGSLFEITYYINLNKDINEKEFIDDLRILNGNLKIILSHPLEESEL
jgi:hypothetical protein